MDDDDDDDDDVDDDAAADDRTGSHAAAAAGPSSAAAAAAAAGAQGKQSSCKKRAAGVAFKDAASLLPGDLDEAIIKRTLQQLQPRNRMQKQALLQGYRAQFSHWRMLLRQHFSLLYYGFGSKQALLEQFAQEALTDGGVLACYGHQPGLNSKQVLQAVAGALTHRSCKGCSHSELLRMICAEPSCRKLYVVLHNIDGPGLRAQEEQLWLSRLSQAPAVHLLASIDHVNAALLWDNRTAAAFKWLWLDVTSYATYKAETSSTLPILTSCKQSAAKRGAATVLSSLVSSAREVFKLLAGQQLEDPEAPGVSFPALLRMVRERFITNSEHALKSVLTEFRDHELIKLRMGPDGAEVMYVPMEPDVLRNALTEMEEGAAA
ncbi:origin recognition complex subunit 2-domain-containing protein [Scenedesmus sp. NREL 46B-D3]|nr:origin recognition complex subunit 2-domain-containing protein [Scenedesmus sp. NREL 46B-D3]